jgi:large subunit ribosomal protein L2
MAIKTFNPTTPSLRGTTQLVRDEITKKFPHKSLTGGNSKRSSGRGYDGHITVRRRGGGHKRLYRLIDFKRTKFDVPAKVVGIEYDPNRTANIALVKYADGEYSYILAPQGLKVGATVESGRNKKQEVGNAMPLQDIQVGTILHNVEIKPGKGGQVARSAGTFITLVAKEEDKDYCVVRMPSGEMRYIHKTCMATIGQLGNADHMNEDLGKAGRSRWLGRRPKVRGVAMNPVDHPLGGGEGKTSGGRNPTTPWGKPTRGYKTVRKHNPLIISKRSK